MNQSLSTHFVGSIAVLTIIVASGTLIAQNSSPPLAAQRTIQVTGVGEATAKPDAVEITLGVDIENEDLSAARELADSTTKGVLAAISNLKIPDDRVSSRLTIIAPVHEQPSNEIRGYRVVYLIHIRPDNIDTTNSVLTAALNSGANRVRGIRFSSSDLSAQRDRAFAAAAIDANARASSLAAQFKGILGDTMTITTEYWVSDDGAQLWSGSGGAAGIAFTGGETVRPGEIKVHARVTATFELKKSD